LKGEGTDFAYLWEVGKAMWRRDASATYTALRRQWSTDIANLVAVLDSTVREQQMRLAGDAYHTLYAPEICENAGLDAEAGSQCESFLITKCLLKSAR
jgi:CSN8/PSMD8/EIF3K family